MLKVNNKIIVHIFGTDGKEIKTLDSNTAYTVCEKNGKLSQYLKVNVHKVYELINDGLLPAFKLGSLKVSRKSLEEFVKSCENDFSI